MSPPPGAGVPPVGNQATVGGSREALLDAAAELFGDQGYHRTGVRAIADQAGVDAALIARYFGNKEGLFLAVLAREHAAARIPDPEPTAIARRLLDRWGGTEVSPFARALVSADVSEDVRALVRRVMDERLVNPITERLTERGLADPQLRAEILLAIFLGVSLARSAGHLAALAEASDEQLVELLGPFLDSLQ